MNPIELVLTRGNPTRSLIRAYPPSSLKKELTEAVRNRLNRVWRRSMFDVWFSLVLAIRRCAQLAAANPFGSGRSPPYLRNLRTKLAVAKAGTDFHSRSHIAHRSDHIAFRVSRDAVTAT